MKYVPPKQGRINRFAARTQKSLLPLVAVGGSLVGMPASALELGDLTVKSNLGQPLRASIAYALAPHEQLSDTCVALGLGASRSGLPGIGRADLSIANGTILLIGNTPIREPMVAAQININCPYTANLSREYMVFVDPASPAFADRAAAETPSVAAAPVARQTRTVDSPRKTATERVPEAPIGKSTRYRVQPGDSLSRIVARIENRPVGLWAAVNLVFQANPDAFIDNDLNKLKAGSWLSIPSFDGSEPIVLAAAEETSVQDRSETGISSVAEIAAAAAATTEDPMPLETPWAETVNAIPDTASAPEFSDGLANTSTARDSNNPFVDGAETETEVVVIPDTELEGPRTLSSSPNVTTAVIDTATPDSSSPWLLWLAGSGLAIIIGLLLFGRSFRRRPAEPLATAAADHPSRRATDLEADGVEVITHTSTILDDDPTAENLELDADLVMGTGLDAGMQLDMEVAEDFGFATPTEIDVELPFEPEPAVPESDTGIFVVSHDDETTVLENGASAADDYDVSIITDATKMPQPEDVTQRDLQAVDVSPVDDHTQTGSYTISSEADLEILEQDYEHELTTTQALNAELARAVDDLAATRASKEAANSLDDTGEMTVVLPPKSATEIDATAEFSISDDDDYLIETGIHEAATIEMQAAENDETAEVEIDDATVDKKVI